MFKKLISCTLALAISLSGMCFASPYETDKGERAVDVVTGLDIVLKTGDYDALVTRAEFATVALRLYDEEVADEFMEGVDTSYADVTSNHYKSVDIAKVCDMGIMNGFSDGTFRPEENLQLVQAVKIVLDLLGYSEYVQYNGGYPDGYMKQAVYTKLVSSVNKQAYDAITYRELCQIIYNAIDVSFVKVDHFTKENVIYVKDPADNFLSKYHKIYRGTGVITANFVTEINGSSNLDVNEIKIADTIFMVETNEFDSLVGYNTEYYYEESSNGLVLHYAIPLNNKEIELSGRDISYASGSSVHYRIKEGGNREISLADNGNIIYNGIYLCKVINYNLHDLVDMSGFVKMIDTNRDNAYDVVFITEYKNYILEKTIVDKDMIFLKGLRDYIEIDKNTTCEIFKGKERISISDLEKDSLVSVAISDEFFTTEGKRNAIIVASSAAVTGKVDSLAEDEVFLSVSEGKNIFVAGYKQSKNYIGENKAVINLNSSGLFHIDALGEIGYFQQSADSVMQYGYIIEAWSGSRRNYEIRILNESGEIIQCKVKEKLKVDGYKKSYKDVESILMESSSMPGQIKQLIRFSIDANGEISNIDTILENGDNDTLALTKKEASISGLTWTDGISTFSVSNSIERYIIRDEVKIFVIPTANDTEEDDYTVRSTTYLVSGNIYGRESTGQKLIMYNVEEGEPLVIELRKDAPDKDLGGINQYDSDMAVIERVRNGYDADDDECLFIDVMVSNAKKTLVVPKDDAILLRLVEDSLTQGTALDYDNETPLTLNDLKFGDCILYYEEENGETTTILRLNESNILETSEAGPVTYGVRNMGSYLERMWASVRDIDKKKMLLDISNSEGDLYVNAVSTGIQYYLVDNESRTVTKATIDDIIYSPYDEYADKLFVRTRAGAIKQIVIYR